jgi:hypothetical protein
LPDDDGGSGEGVAFPGVLHGFGRRTGCTRSAGSV